MASEIWQRAWKKFGELIATHLGKYKRTLDENKNFLVAKQHLLSIGAQRCLTQVRGKFCAIFIFLKKFQVISEQNILTNVLAAIKKLMGWNAKQIIDYGEWLKNETKVFTESDEDE